MDKQDSKEWIWNKALFGSHDKYTHRDDNINMLKIVKMLGELRDSVDALLTTDYENGFADGFEKGYDRGCDKHRKESDTTIPSEEANGTYETGYNDGYDDGYDKGYDEGYNKGRKIGYDEGYDSGHFSGYVEGHDDGNKNEWVV